MFYMLTFIKFRKKRQFKQVFTNKYEIKISGELNYELQLLFKHEYQKPSCKYTSVQKQFLKI